MKYSIISFLFIPLMVLAAPSSQRELTGDHIKNGAGVLALPTSSDTLVGRATADTLTNKSIAASGNTITGIANGNISAAALIDFSKLAVLTNGNILIGNGSGVATSVTPSGDITLSNTGAFAYSTVVPIAKGGTANGSLTTTAGGMLYTDGTKAVNTGAGTTGQVMMSNGGSPPAFQNTTGYTAQTPSCNAILSIYAFFVNSSGITLAVTGDTYSHNGQTYTISANVVGPSKYLVIASGTGTPTFTGGTLTRTSGTGDVSIVFTVANRFGTYTTPSKVRAIELTLVAGGGGGAGTNSTASSAGGGRGGYGGSTMIAAIASPDSSYYCSNGGGGTGGTAGANAGTSGFPTIFMKTDFSSIWVVWPGQGGATYGAQTSFPACSNIAAMTAPLDGGTGPSGILALMPGGPPGQICVHSATVITGHSAGGSSFLSPPGYRNGGTSVGDDGASNGCGGSGGTEVNNSGAAAGGNGASGASIVKEYY